MCRVANASREVIDSHRAYGREPRDPIAGDLQHPREWEQNNLPVYGPDRFPLVSMVKSKNVVSSLFFSCSVKQELSNLYYRNGTMTANGGLPSQDGSINLGNSKSGSTPRIENSPSPTAGSRQSLKSMKPSVTTTMSQRARGIVTTLPSPAEANLQPGIAS